LVIAWVQRCIIWKPPFRTARPFTEVPFPTRAPCPITRATPTTDGCSWRIETHRFTALPNRIAPSFAPFGAPPAPRSSSPNCTRENPRNPCTLLSARLARKDSTAFSNGAVGRTTSATSATTPCARQTALHHLDSPTLLKKRLGIATEDERLLRAKMAKMERQIQNSGKRKDNEPVSESNLPKIEGKWRMSTTYQKWKTPTRS